MIYNTERGSQTHSGLGELGMVEEVEYLAAKFQLCLFRYVEGFVGREIEVHNSSSPHAGVNPRLIAKRKGPGFREATGVEPM